jgi:hypothetical protein
LALAVFASSHVALRCSLTSVVMPESCCPIGADEGAAEQRSWHASIAAPGCCERVVVTIGKLPANASARAPECPLPSVTSAAAPFLSVLELFAKSSRGGVLRAARLPGIDTPPFLLRHSFLI